MTDTILPALIIFVILLGIALYGLYVSNAAAERLNGSRRGDGLPRRDDMPGPRDRSGGFGTRL